jgi:hypothetical protein
MDGPTDRTSIERPKSLPDGDPNWFPRSRITGVAPRAGAGNYTRILSEFFTDPLRNHYIRDLQLMIGWLY